tara:strand:+ start:20884 stop:21471 length:588 start_codon:yes stop_codon:yes gene_type:complete
MKNIRTVFFSCLVLLGTDNILAQHNHGAGESQGGSAEEALVAPHGGQLQELGRYKIELITNLYQKEDQLTFYIFKGELKPLSTEGITGIIRLNYANGEVFSDTLRSVMSEFFVGSINSFDSFTLTVEFTIKKKKISTVYTHESIGRSITYTCSMHPEIKTDAPGNCTICSMELIPVNEPEKQQNDSHEEGHQHQH